MTEDKDKCLPVYPFSGLDFTAKEINALLKSIQNKLDHDLVRDGLSAYQVAVQNGYTGTELQWLASLRGKIGMSAYQVAVDNGFEGTPEEWLKSLNAYSIAVENGFHGTEEEWLDSLKLKFGDLTPENVEELQKPALDRVTERLSQIADDEDLVSTALNAEGQETRLKFADKAYNAASFSGLGRKYLRKNIVMTRAAVAKNILTQEMINEPNTIYHIQYDYDLEGRTINIPENCVLKFEGGSFKNGLIKPNRTELQILDCYQIFNNISIKSKNKDETFIGTISDINIVGTNDNEVLALLLSFDKVILFKDHNLNYSKIKVYKNLEVIGNFVAINMLSKKDCFAGITFSGTNGRVKIKGVFFIDITPTGIYGGDKGGSHPFGIRNSILNITSNISLYLYDCVIKTRGTGITFWGDNDSFEAKGEFLQIVKTKIFADMFCVENGCKINTINDSTLDIFEKPYYGGDVLSNLGDLYIDNSEVLGTIESGAHKIFKKHKILITNSVLTPWFGIGERGDVPDAVVIDAYVINCTFKYDKIPNNADAYTFYKALYNGIDNLVIDNNTITMLSATKFSTLFNFKKCNNIVITKNQFDKDIKSTENYDTLFRCSEFVKAINIQNNTINNKVTTFINVAQENYNIIKSLQPNNIYNGDGRLNAQRKQSDSSVSDQSIMPKLIFGYIKNSSISEIKSYKLDDKNIGAFAFNTSIKKPIWWDGDKWVLSDGNDATKSVIGWNNSRPTEVEQGFLYFDKTLNIPIWWNGSNWTDANHNVAATHVGMTPARPSNVNVGFLYFDQTLNQPIWWDGSKWVKADGANA